MIRVGDAATQLEFTQAMDTFKIMFPDIEVDVIEAVLRSHNGVGWRAWCHLCCLDNKPGGGQGERPKPQKKAKGKKQKGSHENIEIVGTRIRRPNQYAVTSENSPNNGEKEKSKTGKREKTNPDDLFYPNFLTPAPPSGGEPTPSPGDAP